jgi:hypothetical protein
MRRIILLSLLVSIGCAPGESALSDPSVVATIDGAPLMQADLELYFQLNLLDTPEVEGVEADSVTGARDRVKSRLFDAFVEERAMLAEAERRAIRISDREIDAYLDLTRSEGVGGQELPLEARRQLARQRLAVQRLEQVAAEQILAPTDEEVQSFADETGGSPEAGRRVLLRALLFESVETAEAVRSDIRRNRTSFSDAALVHETQPGQSAPRTLEWAGLSEQVRQALRNLDPGEVSQPLDYNGQVFLIQIQAWLEDAGTTGADRLRIARRELELRRRREAAADLLDALLEKTEIRLQIEHLDFHYIPDADG